jgi:toxin ParE1/3/4
MAEFRFTKKAVDDLSAIWEYTVETWSEKQADHYYKLIINACSDLANNLGLGKNYIEIYPYLFGKQISRHLIFYRIIDDSTIEIVRILHDQMDLKSKLTELSEPRK